MIFTCFIFRLFPLICTVFVFFVGVLNIVHWYRKLVWVAEHQTECRQKWRLFAVCRSSCYQMRDSAVAGAGADWTHDVATRWWKWQDAGSWKRAREKTEIMTRKSVGSSSDLRRVYGRLVIHGHRLTTDPQLMTTKCTERASERATNAPICTLYSGSKFTLSVFGSVYP